MAGDGAIDPASLTLIGTVLALFAEYGPWALAVIPLAFVFRFWRSGEFISKAVHDQITEATRQRYLDLLDRFNNQQEAIRLWREHAERAARAAEQAQTRQAEILAGLGEIAREIRELRDDLRDRGWDNGPRLPDRGRRPPGAGAREGA